MALNSSYYVSIPAYYPIPDHKGHWISGGTLVFYSKHHNLILAVPKGWINDLASVPWFVHWAIGVNGSHRIAAAFHDYLYSLRGMIPEKDLTRKECDDLFLEMMNTTNANLLLGYSKDVRIYMADNNIKLESAPNRHVVDSWKAKTMHRAVRWFGGKHWKTS